MKLKPLLYKISLFTLLLILASSPNAFIFYENKLFLNAVFGVESAESGKTKEKSSLSNPSALFAEKISGLKRTGKIKEYGGKDLYIAIDGEADLFLSYGFIKMYIVRYEMGGRAYDIQMAQVDSYYNAYGLLSSYTNEYGKFVKIGTSGFMEDNVLSFYKDKWFVRIQKISGTQNQITQKDLQKLAVFLAGKIRGNTVKPLEISFFPKQNLILYSIRYVPENVLGRRYFKRGFEAEYKCKGKTGRAFIVIFNNKEQAADTAKKRLGQSENLKMTAAGKYIAGTEGFEDKAEAGRILKAMVENIRKQIAPQK